MSSPVSLPEGYQQDAKFWFHDGSIILVAHNAAFKVHQGVLSRHSEVFRDLFAVPQPVDREMLDGCPLLRMQDDPARLRYLLYVLYDNRRYYMKDNAVFEFEEIEALIKLGHKYQITDLFGDALGHLKVVCTSSYHVWEAYVTDADNDPRTLALDGADAIAAVNIARMIGEDTMLPIALYHCCLMTGAQLLAGRRGPGGVVERLTCDDLSRCIDGKATLAHREMLMLSRILVETSTVCTAGGVCFQFARQQLQERAWTPHMNVLHQVYSLQYAQYVSMHTEYEPCDACVDCMISAHQTHMRETWERLPSYFGLGSWEDLKRPREVPLSNSREGQ